MKSNIKNPSLFLNIIIIALGIFAIYLVAPFFQFKDASAQTTTDSNITCRGWTDNRTADTLYSSYITRKIGIGTTTPASKLDVVGGDINIDTGRTIYSRGTMGIGGEGALSVWNKGGVTIARGTGGNGNLTVEGILTTPQLCLNGSCKTVWPVQPQWQFGGMYQTGPYGRVTNNPMTGASNCPAGFTATAIYYTTCSGPGCDVLYFCWK